MKNRIFKDFNTSIIRLDDIATFFFNFILFFTFIFIFILFFTFIFIFIFNFIPLIFICPFFASLRSTQQQREEGRDRGYYTKCRGGRILQRRGEENSQYSSLLSFYSVPLLFYILFSPFLFLPITLLHYEGPALINVTLTRAGGSTPHHAYFHSIFWSLKRFCD